jgi:hypothetical protein
METIVGVFVALTIVVALGALAYCLGPGARME